MDIQRLYENAESDIARNFDEEAVTEDHFLIEMLARKSAIRNKAIENYRKLSPFLFSENYIGNVQNLKQIKTRCYYEPDLEWQNSKSSGSMRI